MSKVEWRYSCYPFMREKSCLVDYEIRTDSLTTQIGQAIALLEKEEGTEEVVQIRSSNPSICVSCERLCERAISNYRTRPCLARCDL